MQNWKKGCVFGHIDTFWKGHEGQIKKNACKNAHLGSIFIPEKYVIRVLFVCPCSLNSRDLFLNLRRLVKMTILISLLGLKINPGNLESGRA